MIQFSEKQLSNNRFMGVARLSVPQSLNVLTLEMVNLLYEQLFRWERDEKILFVCLTGEGKSFCAGGDVVRVRGSVHAGDDYYKHFFASEYKLDLLIHQYSKPFLCFAQGYLIGGGAGLFSAAAYRIVSDSVRFSMPEVRIGFYPDVGASRFLGELPHCLGLFTGFTACELVSPDLLELGMADAVVSSSSPQEFCAHLLSCDWPEDEACFPATLKENLKPISSAASTSRISALGGQIEAVSESSQSASEYFSALMELDIQADWYANIRKNLQYASPHSLAVVYRQLNKPPTGLPIRDVFKLEWALSVAICQHNDFSEGVRALLVDKDLSPRWSCDGLSDVDDSEVEQLFTEAAFQADNLFYPESGVSHDT